MRHRFARYPRLQRLVIACCALTALAADLAHGAGNATLARAADLMEALYECDGEVRETAGEAARKLLAGLGLTALDYTEENRRLFNALPSKSETRTLSPAIVSLEDRRLLRRGTAAVRTDAA